ncbi:uncharacterized protein WCC33_015788 [Rhinophrynus dorsalis]
MIDINKERLTERILGHALGIIHLLTGEEYVVVKKNSPNSRIPLRTGQVPITCGDVSVYFSMEEWEYIEGHKEIYQDIITDNHHNLGIMGIQANMISGLHDKALDLSFDVEVENWENDIQKVEINSDTCADIEEVSVGSYLESLEQGVRGAMNTADGAIITSVLEVTCPAASSPDGIVEEDTCISYGFHTKQSKENVPIESTIWETENLISNAMTFQCEQQTNTVTQKFIIGSNDVGHQNTTAKTKRGKKSVKSVNSKSMSTHQQTHSGEKPYQCECGKQFNFKSHFKIHQRRHLPAVGTMSKNVLEETCSAPTSSDGIVEEDTNMSLESHTEQYEQNLHNRLTLCKTENLPSTAMTFQCEQQTNTPSPSFINDNNDGKQQNAVAKTKKGKKCVKRFGRKPTSTVQQTLSGEKPYQCHCGKQFDYKSHLNIHQRTHMGENPYSCNECGRQFTSKYYLNSHRRTHTKKKVHRCTECGKYFGSKLLLLIHQRTHTGEKSFKGGPDSWDKWLLICLAEGLI